MKTAVLALMLAASVHAEWVTPKGKTFHTHRACIALRATANPTEVSRAEAERRGLRICGICARRKAK